MRRVRGRREARLERIGEEAFELAMDLARAGDQAEGLAKRIRDLGRKEARFVDAERALTDVAEAIRAAESEAYDLEIPGR